MRGEGKLEEHEEVPRNWVIEVDGMDNVVREFLCILT
jgi:hypothetical protein